MVQSVCLKDEKLESFMKVIDIFKTGCQFVNIKESKCKLFGNDKRNIYEADLSPIIGDNVTLSLHNIPQKYKLFNILKEENNFNIIIDEENKKYVFHDEKSKVVIPYVPSEFIDKNNSYISDDDYNKRVDKSNLELITSGTFDKTFTDKIKSFSKVLQTKLFHVEITDDLKVKFVVKMNDACSSILSDVMIIENNVNDVNKYGSCQFKIEPITTTETTTDFNLYCTNNKKHMLLELSFIIGKEYPINFKLWNIGCFS